MGNGKYSGYSNGERNGDNADPNENEGTATTAQDAKKGTDRPIHGHRYRDG